MLGEQFYNWLRQATAADLQRARDAIQFEMEMREQQQRMAYERHWREFPLPCIHVCQREGCQRLCYHQSNHAPSRGSAPSFRRALLCTTLPGPLTVACNFIKKDQRLMFFRLWLLGTRIAGWCVWDLRNSKEIRL